MYIANKKLLVCACCFFGEDEFYIEWKLCDVLENIYFEN